MTFSRRNFLKTFTAAIVASALDLRMAEPLKLDDLGRHITHLSEVVKEVWVERMRRNYHSLIS